MSVPFYPFHSILLRPRLGVYNGRKGIEWNDHKGMERNGMYLSKRQEWKIMEWNGIK